MSDIAVGQTVLLADGRNAIVRFVGQTLFAPGEWVGVELGDDGGKNDGSVQGERYFECEMGRGMFLRPPAISVVQAAPPPQPKSAPPIRRASRAGAAPVGPGRPSSRNDPSFGKRRSLNAPSPSPVPRPSRTASIGRSPTRSPTKQLRSTAASSNANSRTGTPANARSASVSLGAKPRPSMAGVRSSMGPPALPSSKATRQPSASSTTSRPPSVTTRQPSGRPSVAGPGRGLTRSASGRVRSGESLSGNESGPGNRSDISSPFKSDGEQTTSPVQTRTKALEKLTGKGASSAISARTPASATSSKTAASAGASRVGPSNAASRENEDLKAKLKVLERKRLEDREKLKDLERLQEQRDKFETVNKKIEGKFQATAQENAALRKQLKEAEERLEQVEALQAEHDSVMELATLDREMAEETAEVLKVELEALKQKAEELELENEILREENSEFSNGMSPEERASTGWLQMERNNERLREALIRLRDITSQQEEELKAQIKELQQDLEEFDGVKEQYQIAKEKLLEAETRAEDLRQQLDDNLGAEAMIEQLSYEKLAQSEQIQELKAVIEDLEALKEINDELEINHVQNEKEMQEELDFKDAVIAEQIRRATQQDEAIEDMEYTLSRFRELVTNLQTDLEDMRASHAVNEVESEQLESKSRAMMDLNQKLQISAAKTQIKTIDLELQRMDAQEAQQHLQIVKLFLPDTYNSDRDSVLALLRFSRLAFKANLLHGFIKERVNGQPHPGHEDDVFAGCDALDKLTWVSAMCDRFVNAISHCSLEEFARYEGALYELEPVERALNAWIDGLRKDDLKEKQCASELQRTIAVMTHLGEVHISDGLESFADEVQMKTVLMQSHLESAATTFGVVKDMVQRVVPPNQHEDELAQHFGRKSDAVISQTRSTKVIVSKALRSLEDLKARSLSLTRETTEVFEQCEHASQELAEMARKIGTDLHALASEEGRAEPLTYSEIQSAVHRSVMTGFSASESDLFSTYLSKLRVLSGQISDLAAVSGDLSQTQEFERSQAPWVLRAQELKATKTIPLDAEEEMRQLREAYNQARRDVATRDENLSTAELRINTLEARMRDAHAKASRMADLEAELARKGEQLADLRRSLEEQEREARALEEDRDRWQKIAGDTNNNGKAAHAGADGDADAAAQKKERAVATAREMDALRADIAALQAAVRYLREDSRRARAPEQARHAWLAEPLLPRSAPGPAAVAEQRKALVRAEGRDALGELLGLATSARPYDLRSLPADRLATWRPARTTPRWHAARLAEDYAAWKDWSDAVAQKAGVVLTSGGAAAGVTTSGERKARNRAAAKLHIRLPGTDGKVISPAAGAEGVRIAGSREWEGFLGRVGVL
ncbi:hypothetical protein DL764_008514 [Monosporascus ibericus]|uniref:CAP-Gly domain-containing protein n=1 Tax=Monosporascus ibericus TaxID=155417 RepID=A0A4Q4T0P9_9PEZI|nr:hypothetical protein DL764_008514 [Monosporascus ibericus]